MKPTTLSVAVAVAVAACGRHTGTVQGSADSTPPAQVGGTGPFSLRIAGDDKGDFAAARLRVQAVQVTDGTNVLADAVKTPEVDLAQMDQSWLLTSFDAPVGVEDVEFVVTFSGGTLETAHDKLDVDASCQTLRLAGKMSQVAQRRHAVIHLDVARSFVQSEAGVMLVPHFQLVY